MQPHADVHTIMFILFAARWYTHRTIVCDYGIRLFTCKEEKKEKKKRFVCAPLRDNIILYADRTTYTMMPSDKFKY